MRVFNKFQADHNIIQRYQNLISWLLSHRHTRILETKPHCYVISNFKLFIPWIIYNILTILNQQNAQTCSLDLDTFLCLYFGQLLHNINILITYNYICVWRKGEVCTRFWWGKLRERDHWGDQDVDGRIILRWIFRQWEGVVGTEWSWLRIGTGGGRLWVR